MFKEPLRILLLVHFVMMTSYQSYGQQKNGFNLSNSEIPENFIKQGGPPKDGIPALTNPKLVSIENVDYLTAKDRVVGVSIDGEQRAYPIKILNYHEIVNDKIGSLPLFISYCPLCGSALVFNALIDDKSLEFGVSGLLYNSDVLMYDRQTNSLWSQIMMKAISGEKKGTKLEFIESENTTWEDWKSRYPNSLVLSKETGYSRNYERNPYDGYSENPTLFFPVSNTSDILGAKELILGVEVGGNFKAYPFKELKRKKSVKENIGSTEVLIKYDLKSQSALVESSNNDVVYFTTFWFAWYTFHPETTIYDARHK